MNVQTATTTPTGGYDPREGGAMVRDIDIARWRLRSQRLVRPYARSAGEVVRSLLAVQAENPRSGGVGRDLPYAAPGSG